MVPSDWEAQNLHQPNNPKTVADMKAAISATVLKRGMFNLVFHPHGWMRNDQVNELIDYCQTKYGKRVKFLTFRECIDRINEHLLLDHPLRQPDSGEDNGVRIVDFNADGFVDVMIGNDQQRTTRLWQPDSESWLDIDQSPQFVAGGHDQGARFGTLSPATPVAVLVNNDREQAIYQLGDSGLDRQAIPQEIRWIRTAVDGIDQGVRLRDLDRDGISELIVANANAKQIWKRDIDGTWQQQAAMPFAPG